MVVLQISEAFKLLKGVIVDINNDQVTGLSELYPGNSYLAINSILHSMFIIGEYQDLIALLDSYINNIDPDADDTAIRNDINSLIYRYISEELVAKNYGIILNLSNLPDMQFLSGLLEFFVDIKNPSTDKYNDIISILVDDEMDSVVKIGIIVNLYNNNFHFTDAFYTTSVVPMSTIDTYHHTMTTTRETYSNSEDDVKELFSKLFNIDQSLLESKLFIYILSNNVIDIDDSVALGIITNISKQESITSTNLANELIVYAILLDKNTSDIIDIVDTLYEKYNTTLIVKLVTKALGVSSES